MVDRPDTRDDHDQPAIKNFIARHGFRENPKPRALPVVAYYLRRSSADPLDLSIGAQFAVCSFEFRALAGVAAQPVVFTDRHRSGATTAGREGLADLLAAVDGGSIQILIVRSICRLTRNVTDAARLYERLTARGVSIRIAGEGEIQEFAAVILALSAQRERERILESTWDGMVAAAVDGRHVGRRSSPGYTQIEGNTNWRIDEAKAAPIRQAFDYLDGGMTLRAVCIAMHRDGVPPPTGDLWQPEKFFKCDGGGWLQKPILKGELVCNFKGRPPIVDKRPDLAIVEAALFDRVNARFARNATTVRSAAEQPFLLGLVRCVCGSRMQVWESHPSYYVQCRTGPLGGPCARAGTFGIGELVRRILLVFRDEILDPLRGPAWERSRLEAWGALDRDLANERGRICLRLAEITEHLDRLDPDDGSETPPLHLAECCELEHEHHRLSERLAGLECPVFRRLDWERIDELRSAVVGVLQRLPRTGRSAQDVKVIEVVRSLVDTIEMDIGERFIGLRIHFGTGASVGGGGDPHRRSRSWSERFERPPITPLRFPEVVLAHHARAEAGAFELDDGDWRAVQPVMLEAADHHLRLGGRPAAEALVFMQSTGLAPAYLPERYAEFSGAITKRGHAATWLRVYEILRQRRSPVLIDLGPATPVAGKVRRFTSWAYPAPQTLPNEDPSRLRDDEAAAASPSVRTAPVNTPADRDDGVGRGGRIPGRPPAGST